MSAWVVIPCLAVLRREFNIVSPDRDKGADGTIGNEEHTSASDHTPDEDSDVLRDRDVDSVNEVHALDIDSSGPWPDGGAAWFSRTISMIVARERADYESPTTIGRLQYVIWNGRIASRSWGWTWQDYDGKDPHTNHAHFSGRYVTAAESSTRPWGVAPVITPPKPTLPGATPALELEDMTADQIKAIILDALGDWVEENPDSTAAPKEKARVGGWIRMANQRERERFDGVNAKLDTLLAEVANVDEAVAATVFAGTDEQLIPVLREALGAERLRALAAKVLAAG
jgi:hypothetical protein